MRLPRPSQEAELARLQLVRELIEADAQLAASKAGAEAARAALAALQRLPAPELPPLAPPPPPPPPEPPLPAPTVKKAALPLHGWAGVLGRELGTLTVIEELEAVRQELAVAQATAAALRKRLSL